VIEKSKGDLEEEKENIREENPEIDNVLVKEVKHSR